MTDQYLYFVMLPLMLAVYFFGVHMERIGAHQKTKTAPWSSKYWHECDDCMPGVTMKFGANNRHHLAQVVGWHEQDFHELEKDGDILKGSIDLESPYLGTYDPEAKVLHIGHVAKKKASRPVDRFKQWSDDFDKWSEEAWAGLIDKYRSAA